ncbi:tetracycline resistance protein [Seminavis robusta]|uniref:Tetracycline resistance protein n=1 Tax=Seminavis robusta TaxID=568900 RepID=A0A9N8H828_9STRA|nr:tetracycline resistance protein [Seminavis robusta]|eukprot:Sro224_g091590.1 tetracycline resistance protein (698) ;mRNA; f:29182-31361
MEPRAEDEKPNEDDAVKPTSEVDKAAPDTGIDDDTGTGTDDTKIEEFRVSLLKKNKSWWKDRLKKVKPQYRLHTEKQVLQWSLLALRLGSLADAISSTILTPNYPFMTSPGNHPDSFTSTAPFEFTAALYFIPMTSMVGSAISSAFIGGWSDKYGRRPFLLLCVGVSIFGCIAKYLARGSFWGFCIVNFFNGLFSSTLTVALAYVSDVHPGRAEKDGEIGQLVGLNMLGITGGGIIAILMESTGLFTPLFVGAALNAVAFAFMFLYLVEPDESLHFTETVSEEDKVGPSTLDVKLMSNVIAGAVVDNIGSAGLYPMALAPLMFETYYGNFKVLELTPVMNETAYKWITMLLALTVVFGAAMSTPVFQWVGPAVACVAANLVTAAGISSCILIAQQIAATRGSFIGYVLFLYAINPFTVLSNLSTGPMLDRLSPHDRRGFVQGINVTVMNLARSVSPFALGAYADAVGTTWCMWTCVFISVLAAVVNAPLMFSPALAVHKAASEEHVGGEYTALDTEDTDQVHQVMQGDWVPTKLLSELNEHRFSAGLPFLLPPIRSYQEDKPNLCTLYKHSREDFEFQHFRQYYYLSLQDTPENKRRVVEHLRQSCPSKEVQKERADVIGDWCGEYLFENGYFLDGGQVNLMKQMIMLAFPRINADGEMTEQNISETTVRFAKVLNEYFLKSQPTQAAQAFRNSVVM